MAESPSSISRSVEVDAPAERVWALVSDLPRMGELSPENAGGRWIGATGPAVGARFRGRNRRGRRRWSTSVRVVSCEPPHRFGFDVSSLGLAVSSWTYDVAPRAGGCTVTETWEDRRAPVMGLIGRLATGVGDRAAHTVGSIEHTLAELKKHAESPAG